MILSITEKISYLKETELFSDMPVEALKLIAEVTQEMRFADNETIFHDGEKGDAAYFVVNGEIRVHRDDIEIVRVGKNRCVGEMAVIDEGPRSGSGSSVGETVLLRLSRDDFYNIAQDNMKLLQNVIKILLRKLRMNTNREIEVIREQERVMQDLTRAREMQINMLPTPDFSFGADSGPCLKASGYCYPAEKVGGDYYDYLCLPDNKVGLVIGDVMGHGFHTGLMVAMAKNCLQMQVKFDYSIPSVMSAMNDMVCGFMHGEYPLFMTFCYIIVDLLTHTVSFCNAGHSYPYHYRADKKQMNMLESDACPLGMLESQDYEVSQSEWGEGDVFVLYTDGIFEAENKDGEQFGEERFKRLVMENIHLTPDQLKGAILHEFDGFCQDVIQADDVSLVIVKMGGGGEAESVGHRA